MGRKTTPFCAIRLLLYAAMKSIVVEGGFAWKGGGTGPAAADQEKSKPPEPTAGGYPMCRIVLLCGILLLSTVPVFCQEYTKDDLGNRHTKAYPVSRLHRDWIYQDHGLDHGKCFVSATGSGVEQAMVRKALVELNGRSVATAEFDKTLAALVENKTPGNDPAWKALYVRACERRRQERLKLFDHHPRQFIYAKHFVFGDSQAMFAMTDHLTDAVFRECGRDYRMNSQLCQMTVRTDGTVATEVLLDCPDGVVRDPCVSGDGKQVVFSMRRTDHEGGDDFHLYVMDLADRRARQITFSARHGRHGAAVAAQRPVALHVHPLRRLGPVLVVERVQPLHV